MTALTLPPPPDLTDWRERATCADADPDTWYPVHADDYDVPRAFCSRCSVRAECLAAAMQMEDVTPLSGRHGMWGGLTPVERSAMARAEVAP